MGKSALDNLDDNPSGFFGNIISSTLLVVACLHALSYATVYMYTAFQVMLQGDKGRKTGNWRVKLTAGIYLFSYMGYNITMYYLVLSIVNWKGLFTQRIWAGSIFDHEWAWFLFYEPAILILTTWFKLACATHSWMTAPSPKDLLKMFPTRHRRKSSQIVPSSASEAVSIREGRKKKSKENRSDRQHQRHPSSKDIERGSSGLSGSGPKNEPREPFVTIVMPIYNEPIPTLMIAINSVTESTYNNNRMHLLLAFDDDRLTPIYRAVMYCLREGNQLKQYEHLLTEEGLDKVGYGINADQSKYPEVKCDIVYRGLRITPCRFKHGGKRHAQKCAYEYLDSIWANAVKKPLLLFIDSDIQLDKYAIHYFVHGMRSHKRNGLKREAMTGLITCKTAGTYNLWKVFQDTEYVESQLLHRNTEDYLGSVTCLPGALTMVRFESLKSVARTYFDQMEAHDVLDFHRCHLGEDRYLTHLLMEARPTKYRIGFCPAAKCKTEGCESFRQLMKQRRRWYLGTLANEVYMLTSPTLWKQFTALMVIATLQSLKNGPLFVYLFVSESMMGHATPISVGFVVLIFVPIWLFVIMSAIKIGRLKIIWMYPLILLMLPTLSACFQWYGMMTLNRRTWGGPRADADKAKDGKANEGENEVVSNDVERNAKDDVGGVPGALYLVEEEQTGLEVKVHQVEPSPAAQKDQPRVSRWSVPQRKEINAECTAENDGMVVAPKDVRRFSFEGVAAPMSSAPATTPKQQSSGHEDERGMHVYGHQKVHRNIDSSLVNPSTGPQAYENTNHVRRKEVAEIKHRRWSTESNQRIPSSLPDKVASATKNGS